MQSATSEGKLLTPSVYSLKKLGRIIRMTPVRVWEYFEASGVLTGVPNQHLLAEDLETLSQIATVPKLAPVYRVYRTIEGYTNIANTFLLPILSTAFGPKLLMIKQGQAPLTPHQLYIQRFPPTEAQMRQQILVVQNKLIGVLKQLLTNEQDFIKMMAYLEEGDFFGVVIGRTNAAVSQDYITLQREYEACVCEMTSEVMISLPGGLMESPVLLATYPEVQKIIKELLSEFTSIYVDLIKQQCV